MDLTRALMRLGCRRPHVLLVPVPGAGSVHRAAERELRDRGWAQAATPAAADVLLVCGEAGPQLSEQVHRVWEQLPGPRAQVAALTGGQLPAVLDAAQQSLGDLDHQRQDARRRSRPAADASDTDMGEGGMDSGEADMDMPGGADMDMGGMDMPGGLAMAGTGADRDGLELDLLNVQLGPVLPSWPAGLLAQLGVQGDVVVSAQLSVLDADLAGSDEDLVGRLDRAAAVLTLAGAGARAEGVRRIRDLAEQGEPVGPALGQQHRRVQHSRVLRWSLAGLPDGRGGELWSSLLELLTPTPSAHPPVGVDEAADRLIGLELSAVRLALAAAPPLRAPRREPAHA